jgi:hypothetical protein
MARSLGRAFAVAEPKDLRLGFVVTHPFRQEPRKGWGTELCGGFMARQLAWGRKLLMIREEEA